MRWRKRVTSRPKEPAQIAFFSSSKIVYLLFTLFDRNASLMSPGSSSLHCGKLNVGPLGRLIGTGDKPRTVPMSNMRSNWSSNALLRVAWINFSIALMATAPEYLQVIAALLVAGCDRWASRVHPLVCSNHPLVAFVKCPKKGVIHHLIDAGTHFRIPLQHHFNQVAQLRVPTLVSNVWKATPRVQNLPPHPCHQCTFSSPRAS